METTTYNLRSSPQANNQYKQQKFIGRVSGVPKIVSRGDFDMMPLYRGSNKTKQHHYSPRP